ncbi:MAG: DUF370 domain-containing protein [Dethiobacter sp.]|nr:DUF370 domain-containing protein [Dethiobacter sp.]
MYLHIGGSRVVEASELLGIFDIRIKDKQCNREFLQASAVDREGEGNEEHKSFIVTTTKIHFSPIAPGTLKKRFQTNIFDRD